MIDDRLRAVMSVVFGVPLDQINQDSDAESVENWDSLGHLNLMIALENEFGIEFTPEEFANLTQFALVKEIVKEKLDS